MRLHLLLEETNKWNSYTSMHVLFMVSGGRQYDCEDEQVEDVPPPPPPPLALQSFLQQPPASSGFPNHPTNMAPAQPAPVQTFISGSQSNTQSYPISVPGSGPEPSVQQFNYQPGPQPHSISDSVPAASTYNPQPSKGKSSKKSYQQGYTGKKYKHH